MIVVAYNHEAFIDDCLDSIRAQTRQPAQVLIGDDCSPGDDTAGAIRRWCERHPGFAEFHPNPQNLGLNRTLNRLLAMVSTELVTYIAADDLMRSDRIEVHEDLLRAAGSDVPLAYSDAAVIDGDGNDFGLSSTEFPWPPEPQRSTQTLEALVSRNWLPAASMFLRSAALRERGGYCEDIFFEDFELLTRLARHDAFAYSEAPLVTVRRLETSLGAVGFDPTSPRFIRAQYVSLTNALGKSDALDQRVLRILWELAIRARAVGGPWREALGMTLRAQRGAPSLKAKLFRTASALIPRR